MGLHINWQTDGNALICVKVWKLSRGCFFCAKQTNILSSLAPPGGRWKIMGVSWQLWLPALRISAAQDVSVVLWQLSSSCFFLNKWQINSNTSVFYSIGIFTYKKPSPMLYKETCWCVSFLRTHVDNVEYLLLACKHANLTCFVVLAGLMSFVYFFKKNN